MFPNFTLSKLKRRGFESLRRSLVFKEYTIGMNSQNALLKGFPFSSLSHTQGCIAVAVETRNLKHEVAKIFSHMTFLLLPKKLSDFLTKIYHSVII
jgi:hypothetical protein